MTATSSSIRGPGRNRPRGYRARAALVALLAAAGAAVPASSALAEGTVDLNTGPGASVRQSLGPNSPIQVYARAGERIQLGSSAIGMGAGDIRLSGPGGAAWTCSTDAPGTGTIATRAQELAGPEAGPDADPDTWTPCEYVAPTDGIYTVIMDPPGAVNQHPGTVDAPTQFVTSNNVAIWDITVRDAADAVQSGRVFAGSYHMRSDVADSSGVEVFVYTKTGYEYKVNFTNQAGLNWYLIANDLGVIDAATGERLFASFSVDSDNDGVADDFRARLSPDVDRRYPQFLHSPDPIVINGPGGLAATRGYATAPITPASNPLANAAFTGSDGQPGATNRTEGGTIDFTSPAQMGGIGYTVEIDTDRNGTFGDGDDFVDTASELEADGTNSYAWNGRDAADNPPVCGVYRYRVRSTLSEVHFAMDDVENSGGMTVERLTLPGDASLGDPFALSYNDIDPFKNFDVTNATPDVVTDGDSSAPGFHAWTDITGNVDYVDTWARLPEVETVGTFTIDCADLGIVKTGPATVEPGGDVTWTLTVTNHGPGDSSGSTVTDTIPVGVTNVASTTPGCSVTAGRVTCTVGALAEGASTRITITGKAPTTASSCFVNSASVTADNAPDPNPGNDNATATGCTNPPPPPNYNLTLKKSASAPRVVVGDTVTYELVARNAGPSAAMGVTVTDTVPSKLDAKSATATQGTCAVTGNQVSCAVGTLAADQSVTVTIKATAIASGSTTNSGKVVGPPPPPGCVTCDPPGDNEDRATVVIRKPKLGLTKSVNRTKLKPGQTATYRIRVRNPSKTTLRNVRTCDKLPSGLVYVSSKPRATLSKGQHCWTAKTLGAGKGKTYQLTVRALRGTSGTKVNRAVASSPDAGTARAKRTIRVSGRTAKAGGVTG